MMLTCCFFPVFCTVDHQYISFWERVKDQAIESYTMKEVFDMDSSVRVEAIENLGMRNIAMWITNITALYRECYS